MDAVVDKRIQLYFRLFVRYMITVLGIHMNLEDLKNRNIK